MIRVSVTADKSHLANAIGRLLTDEFGPEAFSYCWIRNAYEAVRDHASVVVCVDEGETGNETITASLPVCVDGPLLVMGLSLSSRNLHVVECRQLAYISMEQVVNLVRDFYRTYPNITGRDMGAMKQS